MNVRNDWQLPTGVARGTWDYATSAGVAQDYDEYFSEHQLFDVDQRIVDSCFKSGETVADLGCGTARALMPLVEKGVRGLAVDLSALMLDEVQKKATELPNEGSLLAIRSNLVELDCIRDDIVDGAICLFSTLGMIRGRKNRQTFLRHVRRIIRPGGRFVVHVHNRWFNVFDPDGPIWLITNLFEPYFRKNIERGDRFFPYRGVNNMFLHVFTRKELRGALMDAGFEHLDWTLLGGDSGTLLRHRWLFPVIRAGGWIVTCR